MAKGLAQDNLYCIGDSITANAGIYPYQAYTEYYANRKNGMHVVNVALGGTRIATFADWQAYPIDVREDTKTIILPGVNDVGSWQFLVPSQKDAGRLQYAETLPAILAYMAIPNSKKKIAQTSGVYTGSWSDNVVDYFGIRSRYTTAAAATATFIVKGSTIIVGTTKNFYGGGSFVITIDGVSKGNIECSGGAYDPAYDVYSCSHHPQIGIYSGLTDTEHTVVLTSGASGKAQVDWLAGLSYPLEGYDNKVICGGCVRFKWNFYHAEADYYNLMNKAAVATIAALGLKVIFSNSNNWYEAVDRAVCYDGIHPSTLGHMFIGEKFLMDEQLKKGWDTLSVGPFPDCDFITTGTDDGAAVNEALNALSPNGVLIGYGDLYVDPGKPIKMYGDISLSAHPTYFYVNPNYWYQRDFRSKTFTGPFDSAHGLRIHLTGSAAGNLIEAHGNGSVIKNMLLDGNRLDGDQATIIQAGSSGIYADPTDGFMGSILENLIITSCGDAGIRIPASVGGVGYTNWRDIWINKCGRGLYWESGWDLIIHNLTLSNSYYENINFSGTAGLIQFIGGHFWLGGNGVLNPTRASAIFFADGLNCVIAGHGNNLFHNIVIDQMNYFGIYLYSTGETGLLGNRNIIQGCEFYGADRADTATRCIWTNGYRNVIRGNHYQDMNKNGNLTSAVELTAASHKNVVYGNDWEAANVLDYGVGNIVQHNGT